LHLLTGWPERTLLIGCCAGIGAFIQVSRFQWIERIFGLSGLLMIVFAVSALSLLPDWSELGRGLLPEISHSSAQTAMLYSYFAIGIFSAMLMEYEVHFYSTGAMEEDWTPKDLGGEFYGRVPRLSFALALDCGLDGSRRHPFLAPAYFPATA
jgi:manganese transport protein